LDELQGHVWEASTHKDGCLVVQLAMTLQGEGLATAAQGAPRQGLGSSGTPTGNFCIADHH